MNEFVLYFKKNLNILNRTDGLIQETIRHKFVDSTILCIAHRISTVIDMDRIMVRETIQNILVLNFLNSCMFYSRT